MPDFVLDHEKTGAVSIKVIGVGGGGCNAVDSCYERGLANVDFYVVNSDLQALKRSKCPNRIQIGSELTRGRGCGADPKRGEQCMTDAQELMGDLLKGTELLFIASGLGGGTGTGAAPVLAQMARETGILTVGVATLPFKFEGARRSRVAEAGLERLREHCDTLILINNERLLEHVGPRVPLQEAFSCADAVLANAVQAISDLISTPCLVNLDFNDVRAIMGGRGGAVMGIGIGKGENRAQEAVKKAVSSPLLDKLMIDGAAGVLICITGGPDMSLSEVNEAVMMVTEMADPDVDVIFGAGVDESLADQMRVTLIATGFREDVQRKREAEDKRRLSLGLRPETSRPSTSERSPAPSLQMVQPPAAPPTVAEMRRERENREHREPAPSLKPSSFDEIFGGALAEEPAPRAAAPAPVVPVAEEKPRSGGSLKDTLLAMMSEGDSPRAKAPESVRPATNGGAAKAPAPSMESHPAVRPANRPVVAAPVAQAPASPRGGARILPNEDVVPSIPALDEPVAEARDSKGGNGYDTPAFMRRRNLFE